MKMRRRIVVTVTTAGLLISGLPSDEAGAAFPGANGKIAFESTRDGDGEIYVMNADGSGPTNLTNNPGATDAIPMWSLTARRSPIKYSLTWGTTPRSS
jgi:hypothetical protein